MSIKNIIEIALIVIIGGYLMLIAGKVDKSEENQKLDSQLIQLQEECLGYYPSALEEVLTMKGDGR